MLPLSAKNRVQPTGEEDSMKNLIKKLLSKFGYMPVDQLTNILKLSTDIIETTKRHAKEDLAERDLTIRKLRDELRQERQTMGRLNAELDAKHFSRFIAISHHEGTPLLRKVTEDQISNAIDMADCYEDDSQYFYLDDDGKLYPVSFNGPSRHVSEGELDEFYAENPTIIFSQPGAMVANGKTVGHVMYTDH
jgi:hypothetical protein